MGHWSRANLRSRKVCAVSRRDEFAPCPNAVAHSPQHRVSVLGLSLALRRALKLDLSKLPGEFFPEILQVGWFASGRSE
jgi:hypothetical protein